METYHALTPIAPPEHPADDKTEQHPIDPVRIATNGPSSVPRGDRGSRCIRSATTSRSRGRCRAERGGDSAAIDRVSTMGGDSGSPISVGDIGGAAVAVGIHNNAAGDFARMDDVVDAFGAEPVL